MSKGAVVAIIDTGLAVERLGQAVVLPGVNLSREGDDDDTADHHGHGTAVALTILRLAPRARLVPVKLMGRRGVLRRSDGLEAAFAWLLERRDALGIEIICAPFADSSHATTDEPQRGSRLCEQIAALREMGAPTVAAAGNWYPEHRGRRPQGMAWPAILREVVSVGAARREAGSLSLSPTSQRLHADLGTGCRTTVFALPGEPGETSGAAASVAGCLAALRPIYATAGVDELVRIMLARSRVALDAHKRPWPAIDPDEVLTAY